MYKGKGGAFNRGNYKDLKLIEQVMKVLERVVEGFIRSRIEIDEKQCMIMSGHGTTDAVFIVPQLQEKHFNCAPRDVTWWALRKLGIDEWLVLVRQVQSMYKGKSGQ